MTITTEGPRPRAMRGACIVCGTPAEEMEVVPHRGHQPAPTCCGLVYHAHVPRVIPVEPSYLERLATVPREQSVPLEVRR